MWANCRKIHENRIVKINVNGHLQLN